MLDAIDEELDGDAGQSQWVERGRDLAEELETQAPHAVKTTLMMLQCRVEIKLERIEINISRHRLAAFLPGHLTDLTMQDHRLDRSCDDAPAYIYSGELRQAAVAIAQGLGSVTRQVRVYPTLHLLRKVPAFNVGLLPSSLGITAIVLVCVICPDNAESQNDKHEETAHGNGSQKVRQSDGRIADTQPGTLPFL